MTARPLGPGTWTVGLDIGGTKVHGVLLDEDGTVASTVRLPTGAGITGVVASAAQAVERLAADRCLDLAEVSAVGVGVPGVVDPSSGVVAHAVNLGITGEVRLAALLTDRLGGVPVNVENDLNAAALGAAVGRGPRGDLAFLALGTGLAAGLVLDGAVRRGISGAAGEVGHLPYAPEGPRCACGQHGCLELYASGSALEARWGSRTGRPAAVEVFEAAASGDPEAVAVRDAFADAVATAVRVLALTCDVEHVVLGGGVAGLGEPLREAVVAALERHAASSPFLRSLDLGSRLEVATDEHVAAIGAALAAARAEVPEVVG